MVAVVESVMWVADIGKLLVPNGCHIPNWSLPSATHIRILPSGIVSDPFLPLDLAPDPFLPLLSASLAPDPFLPLTPFCLPRSENSSLSSAAIPPIAPRRPRPIRR